MWPLRSLCVRTDVFLASFDGVVEDLGYALALKTPSNPEFWWGNFIIYREPPDERSFQPGPGSWLYDQANHFPQSPVKLFAWDRPDGARGAAQAIPDLGLEIDTSAVLTATKATRPARFNPKVKVTPLATESDDDWQEATRALVVAFAPRRSGTMEALERFIARQMVRYRAIQRAGLGQWFVAKVDGRPAGALGFLRCDGIGRYQLVGTDPAFARQGVCSTMLYEVARQALEVEKLERMVIAADATYHATQVYEAAGFVPTETLIALLARPPSA